VSIADAPSQQHEECKMKLQRSVGTASEQVASRRRLVINMGLMAGMAGIVAVDLIAAPAIAQKQKLSPTDIGYQPRPNGGQRCDLCVNWQAPNTCKLVAGTISPSGWCGLFVRKA
jgi:hypothetical protein